MSIEAPRRAELSPAKKALLAQRLRQRSAADTPVIPRRPAGTAPPLSFAQERVWFMEQFAPGTAQFTLPMVRRLRGRLDVEQLRSALYALMARHETLRTRYPSSEDGKPLLAIDDEPRVSLTVVPAASEEEAVALASAACGEHFDLAAGPLLRTLLIRLAPEDHVIAILTHHSVGDGWSNEVLVGELFALYRAAVAGEPDPLPPLAVQYGDFAAWQREYLSGERLAADTAYWRNQLAGVEPLALPTDRPRPPQQTFDGAGYPFFVERPLLDRLIALGRAHDCTMYMVLLAAFQVLLYRHSGQRDFAVGSPIAGRPQPELEGLIGMFVNVLALRARLDGDPTFVELLGRARETSLDAYAHQDMPFAQLVTELNVHRDVQRPPVFQTVLAIQNYDRTRTEEQGGEPVVEGFGVEARGTRFDLELFLMDWPDGLVGAWNYNTDLFDEATVARLSRHLHRLLETVVERPYARLSEVDLLDPDERRRVLHEWTATDTPFPDRATLHELVEAQAAATPEATAVLFEHHRLSYRQLDARANQVAHRLAAAGVGPGSLVAVCAERSLELVVGLLGVLKSGAAYVPLDPEYPPARLEFMMADADAPVLLTQRHLVPPASPAQVLFLDDPATWASYPATAPPRRAQADDVAYMIYTSGSTGRPKGVPNTHRGIVNRLDWMQRTFGLDAGDVVLQKTPASFDVSVWEFFWPLLTGARLVLAAPGGHKDAAYLRDLILNTGVTTTHFVPSMLTLFLAEDGIEDCVSLRRVVCSGEELPAAAVRRFRERLPYCPLWNLYGPTEAAVDVSAYECRTADERVPIGAPIQNIRLYVLDEALQPVPVGAPGQLYIGGIGLALGYHRRPALTAQKFVPDPYGPAGGRLYATGDLARWRPDGTLDFLGRIDNQVKLRGLRIELGEIESALLRQPGITEAAVLVRDGRLVAYVVGDADPAALRAALKATLPDYLVPNAFVPLDRLPLTPNGKLDRAALPAPALTRDLGTEAVAPTNPVEEALAAIWREVLGVPTVGIDDDFFALGGHSLLATQVVAKARKELPAAGGQPVSVMDLFTNPTVRSLAAVAGTTHEQGLLYRLGRNVPADKRVLSLVCVPYGGGSAVVYQPLADALPDGYALWSVAIPGHDVGVTQQRLPFDELARRCAAEILEKVDGPVALYGHCGVGSALIVEIARLVEAAGRDLEAVYIGAMFPFARPRGKVLHALSRLARLEPLLGDRVYSNWLTAMGADMAGLDDEQRKLIIGNMRRDSTAAEEYFTARLQEGTARLRAPIVSVMGERDPASDFYQERYREWHFLADTVGLVVLDEAGHFFLKYRAGDLAEIVTRTHRAFERLPARADDGPWWLHGVSTADRAPATTGPRPSFGRFLAVALGQLVSITGSALTEFAIPIWIYLKTGSLLRFALFAVLALVPGMVVAPLAGAIVDRYDRRRIMLAGDLAAGATQGILLALLAAGQLQAWHIYALLVVLSLALTFQRLAYASAVPQLVPKQYLGHANGIVQLAFGFAQFLVPLVAVGLLALIGLGGILTIDVLSYAFAVGVVLFIRFPRTLPWRRREPLATEIRHGFRYSWRHRHFRGMLLFFAALNIFLGPLFLLLTPLVLAFDNLDAVARVAVAGGAGATIGGLLLGFWGGPKRQRMRGMLMLTAGLAACCALTGVRADLWVIGAGAFGMAFALAMVNGTYATIVQVKVPQRFHGRVFAMQTVVAWSTLPLGHALVAPFGVKLFEPLMRPDGALSGVFGPLIGTGTGRGIGLMYLLFALAMLALVAAGLRVPVLAGFDDEVPDAPPDDLVGLQERERRRSAS